MPRRYRIIGDDTHGYEVQIRWRWVDVWVRAGGLNLHRTVGAAELYAQKHAKHEPIEIVGVFPMNGSKQVAK